MKELPLLFPGLEQEHRPQTWQFVQRTYITRKKFRTSLISDKNASENKTVRNFYRTVLTLFILSWVTT